MINRPICLLCTNLFSFVVSTDAQKVHTVATFVCRCVRCNVRICFFVQWLSANRARRASSRARRASRPNRHIGHNHGEMWLMSAPHYVFCPSVHGHGASTDRGTSSATGRNVQGGSEAARERVVSGGRNVQWRDRPTPAKTRTGAEHWRADGDLSAALCCDVRRQMWSLVGPGATSSPMTDRCRVHCIPAINCYQYMTATVRPGQALHSV